MQTKAPKITPQQKAQILGDSPSPKFKEVDFTRFSRDPRFWARVAPRLLAAVGLPAGASLKIFIQVG
jgi:hypothetical protein